MRGGVHIEDQAPILVTEIKWSTTLRLAVVHQPAMISRITAVEKNGVGVDAHIESEADALAVALVPAVVSSPTLEFIATPLFARADIVAGAYPLHFLQNASSPAIAVIDIDYAHLRKS